MWSVVRAAPISCRRAERRRRSSTASAWRDETRARHAWRRESSEYTPSSAWWMRVSSCATLTVGPRVVPESASAADAAASMSTAPTAASRAVRDLLRPSTSRHRRRLGDAVRRVPRPGFRSVYPNCRIFVTVLLHDHPAVLLPSPLRDGREDVIARAVLVDLQRLDAAAQRANSRYQEASQGLRRVERRLAVNRQALGVARSNLTRAQRALMKRLFAIYTSQEEQSSLAVILGAKSLDDLISRIETVNSLSKQDTTLINQVVGYQHQIVHHRILLRQERARQHRLVVVRAAARSRIAGRLASERSLYGTVKSQLQQMIAQQQASQLAAAHRAQLAAKAQASAPTGSFGVGDATG